MEGVFMTDAEQVVALVTVGSEQEARLIAQTLVEDRLAACVNLVPRIISIYHWQDQVQEDEEWLLMIKTRRAVLDEVIQQVQGLHSYDLPEIVALPVIGGSEDYIRWLDEWVRNG
jgi:periplasmic divalent cation tolerance protein